MDPAPCSRARPPDFRGRDQGKQVVQTGQDLGTARTLGHEIRSAKLTDALAFLFCLLAGHHDEGHFLQAALLGRAHPLQQARAIELGHLQIGDDGLDRMVEQQLLPGCLAIAFLTNIEGSLEVSGKRHPHQP